MHGQAVDRNGPGHTVARITRAVSLDIVAVPARKCRYPSGYRLVIDLEVECCGVGWSRARVVRVLSESDIASFLNQTLGVYIYRKL